MYNGLLTGQWIKVAQKPNMSEKCVQCSHVFSKHFETYDGATSGCNSGQCKCDGFAMRYRDRWEWRQTYPQWYATYNNNAAGDAQLMNVIGSNTWGEVKAVMNVNANAAPQVTATSTYKEEPVPFKDGEIIKYKNG